MYNKNKMTIKKILIIISLFLLILTCFRIGWILYFSEPDHPLSENGVIDLSEWNFTDKETITLNGEWEFYPGELLTTGFSNHTSINVPGTWTDSLQNDQEINYGTYRLQISLPEVNKQLYGISFKDISSAAKIYADGKLIAESGHPTDSIEKFKSRLGTYKVAFQPENEQVELIIQVANYENASEGGITKSIKFGTEKAISSEVNFTKTLQLLMAIILIFHSLYAFGLYFMGKNKLEKEFIYFGLLLLFASFSILVDEDKLLHSLFPVNATWSLKLIYISFIGTLFFILSFVKNVFKSNNPIFKYLFILYGIFIFLILILPYEQVMYIGFLVMVLNAFSYTFMFVLLFRITRSGNTDAIYILIANTINLFNVLWGIGIQINMVNIPYYPVDYLLAIMVFSGFLFKRYIHIAQLNEKQTKELQEADKKKDEFLANTSHELRNPLHGVINIAQTLLDDQTEDLSRDNRDSLKLLINVGQRMTFTLNDLLDVSRLKDQQIGLNKEALHVPTVASGVIDMVRFMTEGKDIQFNQQIPDRFPKILADENRFIQIIFNIIHNAVKFTDKGSITLSGSHKDNMATIYIEDTGIGISEEAQSNIFKPYEQEDSSMTAVAGGIGLGLNICKELIELHNGTISVTSTPGKGSIFSFTLPLATTSNIISKNSEEIAATVNDKQIKMNVKIDIGPISHNNKSKILVVDDDPINLRILSNMLGSKYDVTATTNGREALEFIENSSWDLIISDVMMPNMSGYELTKIIRKQFSISELPILLLTARNQIEDIYTGFLAGANDYVSKPMDSLELKSRVKVLTDLKKSIQEQLSMEAAWLQAQIQPHFLFNTLNTIASLSEIDTNRMVKLLGEFANYLRKSFDLNNTNTLIPLDNELDLIRSYLYIEKERFGERLKVKWDINKSIEVKVPPLSIQPIVENAVIHGVLKRIRGGTIAIQVTDHELYTEIAIIDDGVGMDREQIRGILSEKINEIDRVGIGIANTDRRLKKLYGNGLKIMSESNNGTTIKFKVPK